MSITDFTANGGRAAFGLSIAGCLAVLVPEGGPITGLSRERLVVWCCGFATRGPRVLLRTVTSLGKLHDFGAVSRSAWGTTLAARRPMSWLGRSVRIGLAAAGIGVKAMTLLLRRGTAVDGQEGAAVAIGEGPAVGCATRRAAA